MGATAFDDLLAANFSPMDQAQFQASGAASATPGLNVFPFTDAWFASLTVDLHALNAGLEAEEAGVPAEAQAPDEVDEVDAVLAALAASVALAAPVTVPVPVSTDAPVNVVRDTLLAGDAVQVGATQATTQTMDATSVGVPMPVATLPAPGEQATTDSQGNGPRTVVAAAQAAAPGVSPAPSVPKVTVDEPSLTLIETAPAVQHGARTREHLAAKLADMTGPVPAVDVAAQAAPGTHLGSDSQSQTHGGNAQDGLVAFGENTVASRSADGAPMGPVFTVAPPAGGGTKAAQVEGPSLPQAPPAATVPAPENVGRLIESMRVQMRDGIQEATVRLKPEHMGEVTISIRVERGAVSAVVNAETPAVQQWLESQEDKLRSGLSGQGLHLERFLVQRDGSQERRGQPRQPQQSAPRYREQRDDAAVRFEVLV